MKFILSIIFLCTFVQKSFGQGEANNWYFGNKAGITFNSGAPVALLDGEMQTSEGCATLSDSNGQLLLYTDGRKVYNRNHQVMMNGSGLLGHESSTQSGTIIPVPSSSNLYYIFTLDEMAKSNGFRYSIVDMNLDGGYGDVITKNVMIYTPSCEKLTVIKHSNDIDFWIITHGFGSNTFNAHLLTSSGLSSLVVQSSVGHTPTIASNGSNKNGATGAMKISPSGQKIAVCYAQGFSLDSNYLELYNFDKYSGIVSNSQTLMSYTGGYIYGVEFSSSENTLYVTSNNPEFLYQFDLTSTDIPNSRITLYQAGNYPSPFYPRALQLAPDGKIYIAMGSGSFLGCINEPDIIGVGCIFVPNQVDLLGRLPALGLPVFNQSYFAPSIKVENTCLGESTIFQSGNSTVISAIWNFGDGISSNDITPTHTYALPGTYTVSVTATSTIGTGIATKEVIISEIPTATQPNAILLCDDDNDGFATFNLTQNESSILNVQSNTQFGVRYYANAIDFANKISIATPTSYINSIAYQNQTIFAEVYNKDNGKCNSSTTFSIQVFEIPKPNTFVTAIRNCDNTSFGTNNDGKIEFDLTQNEVSVLNGQSPTSFTVQYYKDALLTIEILNPSNYVNINSLETIYVKVTNDLNTACFANTNFEIEVYPLPVINQNVTLKQCDDDNDGFSTFNLTEAQNLIVANATGLTIAYFETNAFAISNTNPIVNLTAYTNPTVSTATVFVRITNANNCFSIAILNLVVSTTQISSTIQEQFTVCDDTNSGSNTDGIATFDFSSVNAQILSQYPLGQLLDVSYYRNLTDALAEQNSITDISNYTNVGYPDIQNIYVRVDSQLNNDCLGLGHHITLNVESIPAVQPESLKECDDDQDGIFGFNTSNLESNLLNGLTNVSVQYWDATNTLLPSPLPNPFYTTSQAVKVRVTNNTPTACYSESIISFIVDDLPEAFPIPINLTTVCDDENNPLYQDSVFAFDTSTFQNTILGTQAGMIVNYFDQNGVTLSSPLPNPFITTSQNITVEVINPNNTYCTATGTIVFVVHPVPEIQLTGNELICTNNLNFTKEINAGLLNPTAINDFSFTWFLNGNPILNETNYSLTVNTEGIYTVIVENNVGCTTTRTITVTASDIALIDTIEITDLSAENSIVVSVSGLGDYEYSLDNILYQDSNSFYTIESGIYTVYVRDKNGCGIVTEEVAILGIPKFFTPNGDGYNDTWNIQGVNAILNKNTIIYIFDRFGKLLKQISPVSQGWDGTFNNQQMPATDYWYTITLESGKNIKGHFSLKR